MLILLLASDSTNVDTVQTYEVPEVVSFQDGISVAGEITPAFYEQSSIDVLSGFPFAILAYGFGQIGAIAAKGRKPSYTRIYLNGHPLHAHPLGYVNHTLLPLHFFTKLSYGESITCAELSAINYSSKINQYDLPYSYAHFMFGSFQSNAYGIDLTRAVTNDLGFYLSGQYHKTGGYRENTDEQTMSFYSNVYYDRFLPIRFDVFYVDNEYGFGGSTQLPLNGRQEDQLFDISCTIGVNNSAIALFYNYQIIDYNDTIYVKSLAVRTDQLGVLFSRHDTLRGAILDYGVHGFLTDLDGCAYRPTSLSKSDVWAQAKINTGRFFLQAGGLVGVANYHETVFCPKGEFGLNIIGSTYLSASVSRDVRPPSDFERWSQFDTLVPYFNVAGDSSLEPEYCWAGEIGLRGKDFLLNVYHLDFTDYIAVGTHGPDSPEYENLDSWQSSGVEGFGRYPFRVYNVDSSAMTEFTFGASFNILISGDTAPNIPYHYAGAVASVRRETKRFGFGIAFRGEYRGESRDFLGEEHAGYSVFSLAGLVSFMSLSCVVRLNNIFDEEYVYVPHYPMAPRNFDVSVKWEFWD